MFLLNTCLSDGHMTFKIGDWSFSNRFISRNFFNNKIDRLSRKQRFKMKTCPNNITLVLENMSYGHINILGNGKKHVTNTILRVFLEILSYWKENSFEITTRTIPI